MGREVGLKKIHKELLTTAQKISADRIFTTRFELFVPDGNTGSIYIGDSSVENGSGANGGWIPRAKASSADNPNGIHVFIASENAALASGDYFDFSKLYAVADNAGDNIIIQYVAAES